MSHNSTTSESNKSESINIDNTNNDTTTTPPNNNIADRGMREVKRMKEGKERKGSSINVGFVFNGTVISSRNTERNVLGSLRRGPLPRRRDSVIIAMKYYHTLCRSQSIMRSARPGKCNAQAMGKMKTEMVLKMV